MEVGQRVTFHYLDTAEQVREVITWHNLHSQYCVLDFETTGLDPDTCKLIHIQMSGTAPEHVVMFGAEHLPLLKELKVTQVGQNWIRYDWRVALRHGVDLRTENVRDTMLMHHLVDETADHSLDAWVQKHFQDAYKERFWEKYGSYQEAPFDEQLEYACRDIAYTDQFYRSNAADLAAEEIPDSLVRHVHRLARALFDTEVGGIAVDLEYVTEVGGKLQEKIQEIRPQLRACVEAQCEGWELDKWSEEIAKRKTDRGKNNVPRPEFSFESPIQLQDLLYKRLKLTPQFDQKTRKITTGDDALAKLEGEHSLIPILREYRGHQKVYTSYIEGTLERVREGRIYPSFNINGTTTGRISHSSPNMGQLPAEGGIRGIYIPDQGHYLVSADYKQLEVVLAAHFSRDRNLLRVVLEGASLHDITAEALGIPRPQAKTINFAIQYGAGVGKIQQILKCSKEDAKAALNKYWETYSGLKSLIDECHAKVDMGDPIVSPYGRKRRFPTKFEETWMRFKAQRRAFNALIQGTGGDITSEALYVVAETMNERGWGKALFSVHDELIVMPHEKYVEQTRELVRRTMVGVGERIGLSVPLSVEVSEGMIRWLD